MVLRKILGAICPILIVPNIRLEMLDPVSGVITHTGRHVALIPPRKNCNNGEIK
jgi:hypothetical protein